MIWVTIAASSLEIEEGVTSRRFFNEETQSMQIPIFQWRTLGKIHL